MCLLILNNQKPAYLYKIEKYLPKKLPVKVFFFQILLCKIIIVKKTC